MEYSFWIAVSGWTACARRIVCDAGFGQAEVFHLALGDQVFHGAGYVFDGHGGIDAVLVEQVDPVGAQPLQHRIDGRPDVVGAAVGSAAALPGLRVEVEAELRGDDHLVAHRLQGFADDAFGFEWTVGLGGVEERHALVDVRCG